MRDVFTDLDSVAVGLRRTMLEEAGIPTFIRNEALSALSNAFIGPFQASLCVVNDEDYESAMTILRALNGPAVRDDWYCPNCKEWVPNTFDSCWKCETLRPVPAT